MVNAVGIHRLDGMLAVSRAFGDLALAPHVSVVPYTSHTLLQTQPGYEDEWLILACDGVWDVLSDTQAAELVIATTLMHWATSMGLREDRRRERRTFTMNIVTQKPNRPSGRTR